MIMNWKQNSRDASRYSVFDAETGECLDSDHIFYVDEEGGFYHRHLTKNGGRYTIWDNATRSRIVAWERVDRRIVLRLKEPVV